MVAPIGASSTVVIWSVLSFVAAYVIRRALEETQRSDA
jgi:membrane protein implicated in regulation of membrane protease activity